jgi:hypothetical protein
VQGGDSRNAQIGSGSRLTGRARSGEDGNPKVAGHGAHLDSGRATQAVAAKVDPSVADLQAG